MKEHGIAFLARLWRFMAAIWTLVIVSALAGALGNIIYTLATTGTITFGNLHNFTSWISANLGWIIIVFLAVLALTICAYIAHRHQARELQKQQQAKDEQLINAVRELKTNAPANPESSQQETSQSCLLYTSPSPRD